MNDLYCVIRVFPSTMFFEEWGTKKHCMEYTDSVPKKRLKVCKVIPAVSWDKNGKRTRCSNGK